MTLFYEKVTTAYEEHDLETLKSLGAIANSELVSYWEFEAYISLLNLLDAKKTLWSMNMDHIPKFQLQRLHDEKRNIGNPTQTHTYKEAVTKADQLTELYIETIDSIKAAEGVY